MAQTKRKKQSQPSPPPKPAGTKQAKKKPSVARAGGVRLWKSEITCPLTTLGEASAIAKTSVINDSGAAIEIERIVDETGVFPEELELYGFTEKTTVGPGGRLVLDFAYRPKRTGPYETKLEIHLASGEVLELTVKASAHEIWKPSKKPADGWTPPEGAGKLGFSGPGGARSLSMGRVKVGASSRPRAITVKNLGTEPLTLIGFAADEELSVTFRGPAQSPTLNPGESLMADAVYTPTQSGMHVSHLFGLTSLGRPEGPLEVHGTAQKAEPPRKKAANPERRERPAPAKKAPSKPVLSSTVDALDIESTAGGAIGSGVFTLRVERGEGPIYFHARDGFSVKEPRNGVSVKAGRTLQVEVRYFARSVGTKQSRLVIQPSFGPSLVVRLRGHGRKLDVEARVPKTRVPVLRRPPGPTDDAKEKLEKIGEVPEKDRVKDGEKRKVRVAKDGASVSVREEWKNVRGRVGSVARRQQNAIGSMKTRLKGNPNDAGTTSKAADNALIFAAASIAELASSTLKQFLTGASPGAVLPGTIVIAGIKDVIKTQIKKAGHSSNRHDMVDNFIDRLTNLTEDLRVDLEERVNNREDEVGSHPEGPRIARAVYEAFVAASEVAYGYTMIEIASQWANLLAAADRATTAQTSRDAPGHRIGRPARNTGRTAAEGMIVIHVAKPLIPADEIHVQSARWQGVPRQVVDGIAGGNKAGVKLSRLRVPYRVVGEGGLLIERWPGEARPRIGLTSEYWLADYWGGRVQEQHLSRSRDGNSPNRRFVKLALEHLIRQLDNETINALGLTMATPGSLDPDKVNQ